LNFLLALSSIARRSLRIPTNQDVSPLIFGSIYLILPMAAETRFHEHFIAPKGEII